jgi:hypothetical protein
MFTVTCRCVRGLTIKFILQVFCICKILEDTRWNYHPDMGIFGVLLYIDLFFTLYYTYTHITALCMLYIPLPTPEGGRCRKILIPAFCDLRKDPIHVSKCYVALLTACVHLRLYATFTNNSSM